MKKYSVIVFDLGNVLIPFDYKPVLAKFNKIKPGLGEKFRKLYAENYHIHRNYEKGILSTDQFLSIMLDWLENELSEEKFIQIYSNIFTVNAQVVNLLPELKKRYMLVLLSNTNPIHKKFGYQNYQFLNYFDKLILSHEVGALKPEETIYRAVEMFTNKPSEEHLFIDDIQEYVEEAKKIGWDGIQFTTYENLVGELKKKEIL
jgi:glucose-1-phosphatase